MPNNIQPAGSQIGLSKEQLVCKDILEVANLDHERRQRRVTTDPAESPAFMPAVLSQGQRAGGSFHRVQHAEASSPQGVVDAFVKICQRWHLSHDEEIILLGYRPGDFIGEHILAGRVLPSSQDVLDRAGFVVSISLGLGAIFGEVVDAEISWISHRREKLNNKSPLEYMLEGHMENLFSVAEMVKHERGL